MRYVAFGKAQIFLSKLFFSQLQTLKNKASGDRPDPRIVVSYSLSLPTHINHTFFQGAFLDSVIHPDSVDDRKGAVCFISPPPLWTSNLIHV